MRNIKYKLFSPLFLQVWTSNIHVQFFFLQIDGHNR